MKKLIKSISLFLAVLMLVGTLSACGGGNKSNSKGGKTVIKISYWNSGFGSEWLESLIKKFEAKYPKYTVELETTAAQDAFIAAFGVEDADPYDLYIGTLIKSSKYCIDLNEILDCKVEGESKTIREKFLPYYLEMEERTDGTVKTLSGGGGVYGVVYNKKIFNKAGIKQLPRTTNELALVASSITDSGTPAFCHFSPRGYWHWMQYVWTLQYEGIDAYRNLYEHPTKELLTTKDGRYQTVKVLEKLVTPKNTLTGSNSESHIAMQTRLLQGKCAMMVNGSWLINEMPDSENASDFEMMKTPVISSITDKLTTVKNETALRKLITAIDNVTDGTDKEDKYKSGNDYTIDGAVVSAADWNYVKTARNTYASASTGNNVFIPYYADAIDGAKLFVKYLYSDEGIKTFVNTTHTPLPIQLDSGSIDTSKWNGFEKNQMKLSNICERFVDTGYKKADKIYSAGGAELFANVNFITPMCTTSEADHMSGDKLWDKMVKTINDKYSTWLDNIK